MFAETGDALARRTGVTRRGQATRQRVIDGAMAALDVEGYVGLKIESVAAQAGIGAGTPYGYFTNKAALVVTIAEAVANDIRETVASKVGPTGMPVATFKGYVHYLAELFTTHPGLLTLPPGTEAYRLLMQECIGSFVVLLKRAQEAGEFPSVVDTETMAAYHLGAMLTLAVHNPQWEASRLAQCILDNMRVHQA